MLDGTISVDAGVVTGATAITSETIDATTNFTIDTSTGIISLGFVPTLGQAITAGYEFDIEMRFDQDELEDIEYILLRQDSSKDYFTFPSLRVIEEL